MTKKKAPKPKVEKAPEPKKEPIAPVGDLHVKPSQEELEANAQKAIEEAEALKEAGDTKDPKNPEPEVKEETPEVEPTDVEALKEELAQKDKKLKASSREGQVLYERNKQVNEAIVKASELEAPSEEELKSEYGGDEWDIMSDFEKKIATESFTNKRRMDEIVKVNKDFKDSEAWTDKVDKFIDDPATIASNPALDGVEEDFKSYVSLPTRRGVSFDILISSFLYQYDAKSPRPKKTQMFPQGSGGDGSPPKPPSTKISVDEGRVLRETNYPEYKRLLKEDKIDSMVI